MSDVKSVSKSHRVLVFDAPNKGRAIIEERPVPAVTDEHALVEIHASAINPFDSNILFKNPRGFTAPVILGLDFSGVIVEVGKGVPDFKVGDEVYGLATGGCFGSFINVDYSTFALKPKALSHQQAAAFPIAFLSALTALDLAKVQAGDVVFIPGGAGGVGHFAVQIAHAMGATVICSGSRDDSLSFCKNTLKAEHVFNYKTSVTSEEVKKLTNGKGADVVYDCLAIDFLQSALSVREGGRFVSLGREVTPDSDAGKALAERKAVVTRADLNTIAAQDRSERVKLLQGNLKRASEWVTKGKIAAHINKVIKFDELITELSEINQKGRAAIGKTVVDKH